MTEKEVRLSLGFIDNRDARAFEQSLSLASFDGVLIDLTPAVLPEGCAFAIARADE